MKRVAILVGREKTFPDALIKTLMTAARVRWWPNTSSWGVFASMRRCNTIWRSIAYRTSAILSRNAEAHGSRRNAYQSTTPSGGRPTTSFLITRWHASWASPSPKPFCSAEGLHSGIVSESLRNLEFPLDWQAIVDYVGFPAFMKPFDGGGWKNVSKVNSIEN